jgi:hypothetical protein
MDGASRAASGLSDGFLDFGLGGCGCGYRSPLVYLPKREQARDRRGPVPTHQMGPLTPVRKVQPLRQTHRNRMADIRDFALS